MNRHAALAIMMWLFAAGPALACDCVRLDPKGPNFAADLDRIATYYAVAAEGELESDGKFAWRFRPTRELRGLHRTSYPIELISDCSLSPDELQALVGKPLFVLLSGEGDRFEISRCINFLGPGVERSIRGRITGKCGRS